MQKNPRSVQRDGGNRRGGEKNRRAERAPTGILFEGIAGGSGVMRSVE
jgi:hypothetical protein